MSLMKVVLICFITCVCFANSLSQTFTEIAFSQSKITTDTSSNVEMLEICNSTFDRLLIGTPNDSLICFYNILSQTKLAYLTFPSNPSHALSYLNKTQPQLMHLDTTFRFGNETKMVSILQNIIRFKINKAESNDLATFEKELELFYSSNKQSARANLVYAIYLYNFKKTAKQNTVESLLKTAIVLFNKEKALNLPINWGKSLAVNLLKTVKTKK